MNKSLKEHINLCYDLVKKAFVLREILNSSKNDKEEILFSTDNIGLKSDDAADILLEMIELKQIEIPDFQFWNNTPIPLGTEESGFNERYNHFFPIKVKTNIKELYLNEIEKLKKQLKIDTSLLDFNKQISVVKDLIEKEKTKLSRNLFDFNFAKIPTNLQKNINLYFVLLYLELEEKNSLKIMRGFIPLTKAGPNDEGKTIIFQLRLGKLILRGDNYSIDLNDCLVKFDNEKEAYPFKANSKAYLLFKVFIVEGIKSISSGELIERLGDAKIPESEESNYISGLLYDIRKDILKTKAKGTKDIINKTKKKYITLRGL